jgi:hypothetical protein
MIKPILNALIHIINFKQFTTIAELSKLAGKKQIDTLLVLNENSRFYRKDKRGRIIGWSQWHSEEVEKVFTAGKTYRTAIINYGAQSTLETRINNKEVDSMREIYYSGGFGDSYAENVILDTPENRTKLEEIGLINQELYDFPSIYKLWVE